MKSADVVDLNLPMTDIRVKFIYTEILKDVRSEEEGDEESAKHTVRKQKDFKVDQKLLRLLRDAVEDHTDESGWANLAKVGQGINNRSSEFDPRNYGFKKLGDLYRAIPQFETEERPQENGMGRQVNIRWKRKR